MNTQSISILFMVALAAALPTGAAVPGFAGNVTGGGNAAPTTVNSLSAAAPSSRARTAVSMARAM